MEGNPIAFGIFKYPHKPDVWGDFCFLLKKFSSGFLDPRDFNIYILCRKVNQSSLMARGIFIRVMDQATTCSLAGFVPGKPGHIHLSHFLPRKLTEKYILIKIDGPIHILDGDFKPTYGN